MRLMAAVLALSLAGYAESGFAQEASQLETRVKAAFLYKFAGYVEWPAGTLNRRDSPIVFGVVGADELAAELTQLTDGRNVEGHPVSVRRVRDGAGLGGVHVLFIGRSESGTFAQLARSVPKGTLLVTEAEGALEHGSVINFVVSDGRVRFEVALDAAERRGLRLSSRMLAVASAVRTAPQ
jgi:hypothetical protein